MAFGLILETPAAGLTVNLLVTWDLGMSSPRSVMVKIVTGHIFMSQIYFSSNFQDGKSGPH